MVDLIWILGVIRVCSNLYKSVQDVVFVWCCFFFVEIEFCVDCAAALWRTNASECAKSVDKVRFELREPDG